MAGAVANIALKVGIEGVETVSGAAERAKDALGGLGDRATQTGRGMESLAAKPGIDATKIQSTTQRAGGALAALTGALDQAGGALGEAGKGFTALGGIAGVLPGPVGLAAAAIIGLGGGFYMLAKHSAESNAKLAQMGDAKTLSLKDKFDLDIDGAIALTQALAQLKDRGVVPSDQLIAQIVQRAKAVGGEPVEAVKSLTDAWIKGAAAVLEYQRVKGNITGLDQEAMDSKAAQLGIDRESVGIAKGQLSIKDQLNAQFLDAVEAARQLAKAESDYQTLRYKGNHDASSSAQMAANAEANAIADKMAGLREQASAADHAAATTQQAANRETELADIEKNRGILGQARDAQSTLARKKALGQGIQLQSIEEQRKIIEDEITLLALQQAFLGKKDYENKLLTLQVDKLNLDVKQKTILDADKAEKKAKAAASATAAAANRAALAEARLGTMRAKAAADGIMSEKERLEILDAEQAKDITAAKTIKNRNVREATITKIAADGVSKRAEIVRNVAAEEKKTDDDALKEHDGYLDRVHSREVAAEDAKLLTARGHSASMATMLRAAGREREAIATEEAQAGADLAAAKAQAEREAVAASRGLVAESDEVAAIKVAAIEKVRQAETAYFDGKRKRTEDEAALSIKLRAEAVDSLQGAADAFRALGQSGNAFAGAFGASISIASKGFKDLDEAMKGSKINAQAATKIIGGAAAGIGAAWIDAEKERTVKQLDNEEKRALSTATTEEQRAAVTADFEARKAKSVDDAERQKAAILGLMEVANAVASYPNIPAMVAHGAAAVMYGAIAGGLVGGSAGAAPAPGGGGGFGAAATPSASAGGSQGAAAAITNNYYGVFGTPQKVASQLQRTSRALAGTGMSGRGL